MSDWGPFGVKAGVLQRYPHFVDLVVRQREGTSAYRLWGASSLNDAYGNLATSGVGGTGPSLLLSVPKDRISVSARASRAGASQVPEIRKGQASFQLDPEDFLPLLNGDDQVSYYRVQERRVTTAGWLTVAGPVNNGQPILGPILPLPSTRSYGQQAVSLSLYGTAPSNTGCIPGAAPHIDETVQTPLPMHIALPRPAVRAQVTNYGDSVGGTGTLLVSFDRGPMVPVAAGETLSAGAFGNSVGSVFEVLVASQTPGGCDFSIVASINFGSF